MCKTPRVMPSAAVAIPVILTRSPAGCEAAGALDVITFATGVGMDSPSEPIAALSQKMCA